MMQAVLKHLMGVLLLAISRTLCYGDQIYKYFLKGYSLNNAIVVVVGDVNTKKTMAMIKEKYGLLKANQKLKKLKAKMDDDELYKTKVDTGERLL